MMQSTSRGLARRSANVRTALALGMVALAAFAGVMSAEYSGSPQVGMGVFGVAFAIFLLVAMTAPGGT